MTRADRGFECEGSSAARPGRNQRSAELQLRAKPIEANRTLIAQSWSPALCAPKNRRDVRWFLPIRIEKGEQCFLAIAIGRDLIPRA